MSVTRWFYVIYWTTLVGVGLLVLFALGIFMGVIFADVAKADARVPRGCVTAIPTPKEMEVRALGTLAPGGHGLLPGHLRTRPAARLKTFHFHYRRTK